MADIRRSDAVLLRTKQIIGQDVIDGTGKRLGKVHDLLLDRRDGEVRLLDVDLGLFKKRVLMPVTALDWTADQEALTSRWTAEQVERLPAFDPNGAFTEELLGEMEGAYPTFYGPARPVPIVEGGPPANVVPLSEARDFKISSGNADVRGWNAFGSDGERVGTVSDMLVDPAALKIRYLAIKLAEDLFLLKGERTVLVPIEAVDLKERGRDAWVRGAGAREIARLPAYLGGPVDPLTESTLQDLFSGPPESRRS